MRVHPVALYAGHVAGLQWCYAHRDLLRRHAGLHRCVWPYVGPFRRRPLPFEEPFVSPAVYVELRALAIARDALLAAKPREVWNVERALRPWPFRWPLPERIVFLSLPDAPPGPEQAGNILDLFA